MTKVSIFNNGRNRAIRLPKDMDFPGVDELEIVKEGNTLVLKPVMPSWTDFGKLPPIEEDFLEDRPPVFPERDIFGS